jgi:Equine arteritis virus serine endopeptidase S32
VTLTNQIGVKPDTAHNPKFSAAGDSGSAVVNDAGEVIGLHCAGNSDEGYGVANHIGAVLEALNVTVCLTGSKSSEDGPVEEPLRRLGPPTLSPYPPPWPPEPPRVPDLLPYPPIYWGLS